MAHGVRRRAECCFFLLTWRISKGVKRETNVVAKGSVTVEESAKKSEGQTVKMRERSIKKKYK